MVVQDTDLAWMAGFIDGEGHISVHASTRSGDKQWYQASMGVRNTHKPSIDHLASILDGLGIKYHVRSEDRGVHKLSYWLNITGQDRLVLLGELLQPYMVTKREQCALMVEWCKSRLVAKPKSGYSEREQEIALEFKTINQRGGT